MAFYASIRLLNTVSATLKETELRWHPDGYPFATQTLRVIDEDGHLHDITMHLADKAVAAMVRDGAEVKELPKGEREERMWGYALTYLQKCTTDAELASAMEEIKAIRFTAKDQPTDLG